MKLLESVRIALRSLTANKLRASLTMLGVIIGVLWYTFALRYYNGFRLPGA